MRSAESLIEEAMSICDEPDADEDLYLDLINRGQRVIAERVMLPGLSNGHAVLTTSLSGMTIQMPNDYHRCLSIALFGEDKKQVNVLRDLKSLETRYSGLRIEEGDVVGVAVHSDGNLYYLFCPAVPSALEIFYYRKPVDMTYSGSSFPDGFPESDDYEQALVSYTCWQIFQRVEQAMEGSKSDTAYHKGKFDELVRQLDLSAYRTGKMYPEPALNTTHWP